MTRDQLVRDAASEFAAGRISEDEYVRRDAAARRWMQKRTRPKVRDRSRARLLACSGPMPPALAARFTESQRAVLAIVGWASPCSMSVAEIAARAGVSTRTVQNTIRLAAADGLLHVRERPICAGRHDTNVVTVVSAEWRQWLLRGKRSPRATSTGRRGEAMLVRHQSLVSVQPVDGVLALDAHRQGLCLNKVAQSPQHTGEFLLQPLRRQGVVVHN